MAVSAKEEQTCEVWVNGQNESFPFSFRKQADGTHVYQITLLDNGEKELYLEVRDKNDENLKQIAVIEFEVE